MQYFPIETFETLIRQYFSYKCDNSLMLLTTLLIQFQDVEHLLKHQHYYVQKHHQHLVL